MAIAAKANILAMIKQKNHKVLAVIINVKYIASKKSFAIPNKSRWYLNKILKFLEKAHK